MVIPEMKQDHVFPVPWCRWNGTREPSLERDLSQLGTCGHTCGRGAFSPLPKKPYCIRGRKKEGKVVFAPAWASGQMQIHIHVKKHCSLNMERVSALIAQLYSTTSIIVTDYVQWPNIAYRFWIIFKDLPGFFLIAQFFNAFTFQIPLLSFFHKGIGSTFSDQKCRGMILR